MHACMCNDVEAWRVLQASMFVHQAAEGIRHVQGAAGRFHCARFHKHVQAWRVLQASMCKGLHTWRVLHCILYDPIKRSERCIN